MENLQNYLEYVTKWLKDQVKKTKSNGLIVGISGGVDSAVVTHLIKKAFPKNSLGVALPCHSDPLDLKLAKEVASTANIDFEVVDLSKTFDTLMDNIDSEDKMLRGNTKARLRMTTLYALARKHNYLVVGTDNACEWHTGFFTKYGDGGVDVVPLKHLTKTEVWNAAKLLGVPKEIIDRVPTASLFDGQTDEQELGVTYKDLDNYLIGKRVSKEIESRIEHLHKVSAHKRTNAPSPRKIKR